MSSAFNLERSQARARERLGEPPPGALRARRSDRGVSRLPTGVQACMAKAFSGRERPRMRDLLKRLEACCRRRGLKAPSRATVYKAMATYPCPTYRVADLPPPVRAALYNFEAESRVPAHQIAFCCANYGDLAAVSFAAGLPWLALYQALRLRGHRRKSRGLLEAVALARGI